MYIKLRIVILWQWSCVEVRFGFDSVATGFGGIKVNAFLSMTTWGYESAARFGLGKWRSKEWEYVRLFGVPGSKWNHMIGWSMSSGTKKHAFTMTGAPLKSFQSEGHHTTPPIPQKIMNKVFWTNILAGRRTRYCHKICFKSKKNIIGFHLGKTKSAEK